MKKTATERLQEELDEFSSVIPVITVSRSDLEAVLLELERVNDKLSAVKAKVINGI